MNKKGFTLIDLMIVVAIIGILTAIAVPNFIAYKTRPIVEKIINNQALTGKERDCYEKYKETVNRLVEDKKKDQKTTKEDVKEKLINKPVTASLPKVPEHKVVQKNISKAETTALERVIEGVRIDSDESVAPSKTKPFPQLSPLPPIK